MDLVKFLTRQIVFDHIQKILCRVVQFREPRIVHLCFLIACNSAFALINCVWLVPARHFAVVVIVVGQCAHRLGLLRVGCLVGCLLLQSRIVQLAVTATIVVIVAVERVVALVVLVSLSVEEQRVLNFNVCLKLSFQFPCKVVAPAILFQHQLLLSIAA